ncbi:HORMA domain-containing protein 2 isoform X1 [Anser cygnoides]|uniref:HORMA domain-containing protein 2 isoform X1 n=1 Tax=Anser cygnoides TaxID=8845 RepID=UPI000670A84E
MMATCQLLHTRQKKSSKESVLFPNKIDTKKQSVVLVKRLLAISVSCITYLRGLFPESSYGTRYLDDLCLKILREDKSCLGSFQIVKWIQGCFDALERQYLHIAVLAIYTNPKEPETVTELYQFKFKYKKEAPQMDIISFTGDCCAFQRSFSRFDSFYEDPTPDIFFLGHLHAYILLEQPCEGDLGGLSLIMPALMLQILEQEAAAFCVFSALCLVRHSPVQLKLSTIKGNWLQPEQRKLISQFLDFLSNYHWYKMDFWALEPAFVARELCCLLCSSGDSSITLPKCAIYQSFSKHIQIICHTWQNDFLLGKSEPRLNLECRVDCILWYCLKAAVDCPYYSEEKRRALSWDMKDIRWLLSTLIFFVSLTQISHLFLEITAVSKWNSVSLDVHSTGQEVAK